MLLRELGNFDGGSTVDRADDQTVHALIDELLDIDQLLRGIVSGVGHKQRGAGGLSFAAGPAFQSLKEGSGEVLHRQSDHRRLFQNFGRKRDGIDERHRTRSRCFICAARTDQRDEGEEKRKENLSVENRHGRGIVPWAF